MASRFCFALWIAIVFSIPSSAACGATKPRGERDNQPPFKVSEWAYRNEEHWAVDQMCRDIAEMLAFAADKSAAPVAVKTEPLSDPPHAYAVTVTRPERQPVQATVVLEEHLWRPATLAALARQLSKAWDVSPQADADAPDDALMKSLLAPTPERIEQAQAQVSRRLAQRPRSPRRHEQAAFCLAVFGLFNCAADLYTDNRHTLNRLAAHLSVAEAWQPDSATPTRVISEIALLHLVGRTAQAVERADAQLRQNPPETLRAWLNVVRLAASTDWRMVSDPRKVTDAERLMAFHARAQWQGPTQARAWLDEAESVPFPAFVLRAMLVQRVGPGRGGNGLGQEALEAELDDIQSVLAVNQPQAAFDPLKLAEWLNARPERALDPQRKRLVVIGWGMWARYFQANILFCLDRTIGFIEGLLGDREGSLEFIETCEATYSELELYPVLMKRYSNIREDQYFPALAKVAAVARKSPEAINDGAFVSVCQPHRGELPPSLPRYRDWLSLPFPFGTTYGGYQRAREMAEFERLKPPEMLPFLNLNPYYAPLIRRMARLTEDHRPTPEFIERVFACTKGFAERDYLSALRQISYDDPEQYIKHTRRLASIEPAEYFKLGDYLAELGRDEEATQAYLAGVRDCPDAVLVSNNVEWLTTYFYENGQKSRAESLAAQAGDVYSATGLATRAKLFERQGKLAAAKETLKALNERYRRSGHFLDEFYLRNEARYPSQAQETLKKIFPAGLRRFEPPPGDAPPPSGIRLKGQSQLMKRFGMPRGAILVAIDGYAVETVEQYHALMNRSLSPDMTFTIFADGRYQTCAVRAYVRRLNVNIEPYPAARP